MGMRQISLLLPFSNVLVSPHACVWGDHIHLNPVVSLLVFVGAEAPTKTILHLLREAWPWLLDALCSGKLYLQLPSFTEPLMLCHTTTHGLSLGLRRQGSLLPFAFVSAHPVRKTSDSMPCDEAQASVLTYNPDLFSIRCVEMPVAIINALVVLSHTSLYLSLWNHSPLSVLFYSLALYLSWGKPSWQSLY